MPNCYCCDSDKIFYHFKIFLQISIYISDPMLPVQGHGLIELTRLVEDKDEITLQNIDGVRLIFYSSQT